MFIDITLLTLCNGGPLYTLKPALGPWQGRGARGATAPFLNFSLSENFLLVGKLSAINTKFVAKNASFWENLGAKLKF